MNSRGNGLSFRKVGLWDEMSNIVFDTFDVHRSKYILNCLCLRQFVKLLTAIHASKLEDE